MDQLKNYYKEMGVDEKVFDYAQEVEKGLKDRFETLDAIAQLNQIKVLNAMQKHQIAEMHLGGTTGYGYNDSGREAVEALYADVFGTEDALVRPQITCGTHALGLALSANLRPGDEILAISGKPYDTLEEVIGIRESKGSLKEYGITYAQVDLLEDGSFDLEGIKNAINDKTKLIHIQRSKGYATRPTLSVDVIGEAIAFVKEINKDLIVMVDNCYGEFVEEKEPSEVGADMIVGASLGVNRQFIQGFFMAPTVVNAAVKGAIFAANLYEKLGFKVIPDGKEDRHDIIQAVEFHDPEKLIAFCEGIQKASPIDSHVTPIPWDMPGYDSQVIMAAGTFVSGASIELSADGPMKEPYAVYFQGGLTYPHAKYGIIMSLQRMAEKGLVEIPEIS